MNTTYYISNLTHEQIEQINEGLKDNHLPVPVSGGITDDQLKIIKDLIKVAPGVSLKPVPQRTPPPKYIKSQKQATLGNIVEIDLSSQSVNDSITPVGGFEFTIVVNNAMSSTENINITVISKVAHVHILALIVEDILFDAPNRAADPINNLLIKINTLKSDSVDANTITKDLNYNPTCISFAPIDNTITKSLHDVVADDHQRFDYYKLV